MSKAKLKKSFFTVPYQRDSIYFYRLCSYEYHKSDAARSVFKEMKQRVQQSRAIVHDGLPSYNDAFQKDLHTHAVPRIQNIRSIGSNENGLNPRVDLLNGTVSGGETVMRCLDNAEAVQELIDTMRIQYVFSD